MQRSRKYIKMLDDDIVDLYATGVKGESKHYLELELHERGIAQQAKDAALQKIKGTKGRKMKFFWAVLLFGVFLYRFLPKFLG